MTTLKSVMSVIATLTNYTKDHKFRLFAQYAMQTNIWNVLR